MKITERLAASWRSFRATQSVAEPSDRYLRLMDPVLFRPDFRLLAPDMAMSDPASCDDNDLVRRIIEAYRKAHVLEGEDDSFWSNYFGGRKLNVHQALMSGEFEAVQRFLREPLTNDLFYGFDLLCLDCQAIVASYGSGGLYDGLLRVAEAVGAISLFYPEASPNSHPAPPDVESILAAIETVLGFLIEFPNPYPSERGLASSRGIASPRAVQALYQAYALASALEGSPSKRVVEIGAGLGRTAYHARAFGVADYTIVDLPMTNVAQAYFLGRTLGADQIALFGENHAASARIIPSSQFFEERVSYDLAVNVDSMTEMGRHTAERYFVNLATKVPRFLSINHEFNPFSMREIISSHPHLKVDRSPYWLRAGYVQEMVEF